MNKLISDEKINKIIDDIKTWSKRYKLPYFVVGFFFFVLFSCGFLVLCLAQILLSVLALFPNNSLNIAQPLRFIMEVINSCGYIAMKLLGSTNNKKGK